MKNSIIKVLTMVIIAIMMLSTVASAAGTVNVERYNETSLASIPGSGEAGVTVTSWKNLDLSNYTKSSTGVEVASDVLNHSDTKTKKDALIVSGYIIPDNTITSFTFTHDDGIDFSIDGTELYRMWKPTGATTGTITKELEKGMVYSFTLEYFDWGGTEVLKTNLPYTWFHDSIPEYSVTYMDGKEPNTQIGTETVTHGQKAQGIAEPTSPGFVFNQWEFDGEAYNFDTPVLGDITLTATWSEVNLWAAVDDAATVYINGEKVVGLSNLESFSPNNYKNLSETYVDMGSSPFFAAEAKDKTGHATIAGFNLAAQVGEGSYEVTNGNWYYYTGSDAPGVDDHGTSWTKRGYVADVDDWALVTVIDRGKVGVWTHGNDGRGAKWIWSPNYKGEEPGSIDTPVYLRNIKPGTPEQPEEQYRVQFVVHPDTDKNDGTVSPTDEGTYNINTNASGTATPDSGYEFVQWWGEFYPDSEEKQLEESSERRVKLVESMDFVLKPISDITIANAEYLVDGMIHAKDGSTRIFSPVSEDNDLIKLYAEFKEKTNPGPGPTPDPEPTVYYDLTVNVVGGGSVPSFEGTHTFSSGSRVNLAPVADEGYEFTGWTGDSLEGNVVVMNSDKSVTANFELIKKEDPKEEILDEVTPEASGTDEIKDEALPQTAGIPMEAISLFGMALMAVGSKFRKK